ncbi:hypothetical protein R4Y45_02035 [Holzapfeliella sp. He02]|uniref:Uncharacterized protein n=1 Tax=Holzapfeliella saturejae TaxID=3082953 RepID=A0ABU8SF52_9LACO
MKKSIFSVVITIVSILAVGLAAMLFANGSINANAEQNHYNLVFNLAKDAAKKENYQSAKQQFNEASTIYDDKGVAKTYQNQAQLLSTAVNYFKNADLMNAKDYFEQAKTLANGDTMMSDKASSWVSTIDDALTTIQSDYNPKLTQLRQLLNEGRYQEVIDQTTQILTDDHFNQLAFSNIKAKFDSVLKSAKDKQEADKAKLKTQQKVTAFEQPQPKPTTELTNLSDIQELIQARKHLVGLGIDEKEFSDEQLQKLHRFSIANHHSSITMEDVEEFLGESH